MVEYTKINCKLTNVQLNKFKKAFKNNEDSPHELLLTTRQDTKLRNAINNILSRDIKFSKAQLKKIAQSGGFLGRLLSPLFKVGLPLMKSVIINQ